MGQRKYGYCFLSFEFSPYFRIFALRSWVSNWYANAVFNFGYLFWAMPANMLLQKLPVAKLTGTTIFLWGCLLVAHVGAKNYGGILALRFILGM